MVEKAGRRALTIAGDVADPVHCRGLVERALQAFGRLEVLVNNAAFQATHESIEEIADEEWDRTFRTNAYGMFYLVKAAVPRLKPGSAIVNTASINSKSPSPELLADKGIRVNCVAPGPIWTPLIPSTMPPEKVAYFGENTPLKRPGQPAELAPAYVLLASYGGSYISMR